MPSFKIRPKLLSRHGRQHVVDANGGKVFFSVGNKSRLSTQSLRHNMEVWGGGAPCCAVVCLLISLGGGD